MPDTRKHRGPGPRDPEWFGPAARPALASAASDLSWLLSRGYAEPSSLNLVGDRSRLAERQRAAVRRSACDDAALAGRRAREVDHRSLGGRPLRIDGLNLTLTLESALGGGVVVGGRDGCYRDLASVHGTYRRVEETGPTLGLAARYLAEWGAGPCTWLLDAPVFRVDFPRFRGGLTPPTRACLDLLAAGWGTGEAAARLGVTPGRVSQLRRELAEKWAAFHDDPR